MGSVYEAGALLRKWRDLVGEQVAKNTEPLMIRGETLIVKTTSPAWSHQLTMIKPRIIEKLRDANIKVNDISFRAASPPKQKEEMVRKPTIEAPPRYSGLSKDLKPNLRRALAMFLGAKHSAKRDGKDGTTS